MKQKRGILTEADREFLAGRKDYDSPQARYQRRKAIRDRTRRGIRDFTFLYEHLSGEDRRRMFEGEEAAALEGALIDLIAFVYRALEGDIGHQRELRDRPLNARFEHVLKKGVYQAELDRRAAGEEDGVVRGRPAVDFDVSFDVPDFAKWDEAATDLAENYGRKLGDGELRDLLVTAAMNTATVAATDDEDVREQLEGGDLEALAERVAETARDEEAEAIRYAIVDDEEDNGEE